MVDAAVAGMDVEKAAGDRRGEDGSPVADLFFEAAFAATLANIFPAFILIHSSTQAFLTNSDFNFIGPIPSILQSIS
mgnify:CR=1 FL=1